MITVKLVIGAFCILWAALKTIDILIELIDDGISPSDVMWWICRPFSFRDVCLDFGMGYGLLVWLVMIVGTVFGAIWWTDFLCA